MRYKALSLQDQLQWLQGEKNPRPTRPVLKQGTPTSSQGKHKRITSNIQAVQFAESATPLSNSTALQRPRVVGLSVSFNVLPPHTPEPERMMSPDPSKMYHMLPSPSSAFGLTSRLHTATRLTKSLDSLPNFKM